MSAGEPALLRLPGRWTVLGAGVAAQAAMSALQQGLPVIGPALRYHYTLSLPALGALLACISWGAVLTLIAWGALADRLGERWVVGLGLGGAAGALLLAATMEGVLALGVTLALAGGLSASAIAASGRAVMGWFARDERGLALGIRQMAVPLGAALASMALPAAVLAGGGPSAAFIALAVAAAAGAVLAAAFLRPSPVPAPARLTGLPPPLRDGKQWHLSLATGLMLWSQAALSAFFMIVLMEVQGLSAGAAAALYGAVHVAGGIARIALGAVSDRTGRRIPLLRLNAVGLCFAQVALALAVLAGPLLAAAALMFATILSYSWNGLAFTAVAEMAGHSRSGVAIGLHGTLMRALSAPAGLAFGAAAAAASWPVAFLLLAALSAVSGTLLTALLSEEELRLVH